jgi:hypothetical protein
MGAQVLHHRRDGRRGRRAPAAVIVAAVVAIAIVAVEVVGSVVRRVSDAPAPLLLRPSLPPEDVPRPPY